MRESDAPFCAWLYRLLCPICRRRRTRADAAPPVPTARQVAEAAAAWHLGDKSPNASWRVFVDLADRWDQAGRP